jgi:hypothetical protein
MKGTNKSTIWLVLCICLYLILSCIWLNFPGLNFDEVLFEQAIFGRNQNLPEYLPSFKDRPLFLVAYSGSLKGYLYWPIFQLFGISAYSIRLPMVILASLSIYLLYLTTSQTTNTTLGKWLVILLVSDITLFTLIRTDVGPSAIEFFCKACALFLIYKIYTSPKLLHYILLSICLGLGIYNKLNFIWFTNALVGALFVHLLGAAWRNKSITGLFSDKKLYFFAAIFVASFSFYKYFSDKFHLLRPISLSAFAPSKIASAIAIVGQKYFGLLSGSLADIYVFNYIPGWVFGLGVLLLVGFVLGIFTLFSDKAQHRPIYLAALFICVFIALQQTVTELIRPFMFIPTDINPWHLFMLYPFVLFCAAYGYYYVFSAKWGLVPIAIIGLGKLSCIILLLVNLKTKQPQSSAWTNAIYNLFAYTQTNTKTIASLDWGTHTQLHTLGQGQARYLNFYTPCCEKPLKKEDVEVFLNKYFENGLYKNILIVLSAHPTTNWGKSYYRENFWEIMKNNQFETYIDKTIFDATNKPIYKIYAVKPIANKTK